MQIVFGGESITLFPLKSLVAVRYSVDHFKISSTYFTGSYGKEFGIAVVKAAENWLRQLAW